MMITNLHEEYGDMEGNVRWELFDEEIEVFIDGGTDIEYAEKCAEALNTLPEETIQEIYEAAKQYCLHVMDLAGTDGGEFDDMSVEVTKETPAEELKSEIHPIVLLVYQPEDEPEDERIGIHLECDCSWEPEHGMEFIVIDEELVYLGAFKGCNTWDDFSPDNEWNYANAIGNKPLKSKRKPKKSGMKALKEDIAAFETYYKGAELKKAEVLNAYIADADKIIEKYLVLNEKMKNSMGQFCSLIGCMVVVFGHDLERGIPYYHKALELAPDDYDIYWGYYTTLEELVEDDECRTPELVQDAVKCLRFCIDYSDTPELKTVNRTHLRYVDLGRVYLADGNYSEAVKCAKASLEIMENDAARRLLKDAEDRG